MSLQKQSILFINGLDKTVNENMLYQLFNDYSVSYIKIAKDHNTRESFGYAFIGFKNNAKAEEAIKKLNYSKLAKKTLRISWYNREPGNFRNKLENNIFVKKIPKEVTAKEFDEHFRQFGNIVSAKLAEDEEGESMGYGFVLYDSEEGAKKAIKECHGKEWRGKKLFVAQFQKNRPKQPPKYNNIYVRNIPKSWSEDDIKKYFSKYGEIGSMIVRIPEADKLKKELPEEKRKHILEHKYAFVCFKSLDGPAKKAVAKVPYLKIDDEEYNKKIEELSNKAKEAGIGEDDIYKCACFILDNNAEEKINNKDEFDRLLKSFNESIKENDGVYIIKNKEGRLDCCQALKKAEREKKLKQLYEKIKRKIKEKYKFCNLYVKNLPNDYTDEKLKELFGQFGQIRSAKVVKKELESHYLVIKKTVKVFGFVCFFEPEVAKEAKTKLKDHALLVNGPKLYVDYHQTKKERTEFLKLKLLKNNDNSKNRPNQMFQPGMPMFPPMNQFPMMPMGRPVMMPFNNGMRQPMMNMPPQQPPMDTRNMDKTSRQDYYGEQLFTKISKNPKFEHHANYFSKIVGIFLDLDDKIIEKLLSDDKYFEQQVEETIHLLTEKQKSG
jgi:polyadenylate-binding protein